MLFEYKMYVPLKKMHKLERINNFMKKIEALSKQKEEGEEDEEEQENKGFLNSLGSLFTRGKKPADTKKLILSPEDEETKRIYEQQLELVLTDECVMCGSVFIESVDMPFDLAEECVWTI